MGRGPYVICIITEGPGRYHRFKSIISEIGTQEEKEVAEVVVAVFSITKPLLCFVISQACRHGCKKSGDRGILSDSLVLTPETSNHSVLHP